MHTYRFGYDPKGRHITESSLGGGYWEENWRFYLSGSEMAEQWLFREPGVMWC